MNAMTVDSCQFISPTNKKRQESAVEQQFIQSYDKARYDFVLYIRR